MKRLIIAACIAAMAGGAIASDFAVGINLLSWHNQPGYETVTPGIYVRSNGPVFGEIGVFRNSYGFTTTHAAVGYSYKVGDWDFSIAFGASYGYRKQQEWIWADGSHAYTTYEPPKANPLVLPGIGYRFDHEWGIRAFVIPALKGKSDTWCFSFAVERYF